MGIFLGNGGQQTLVATLHQYMCRMEEYFTEADRFVPERWVKGHALESRVHPYLMLPFGFGTRMCIGRRLAELEMWLITVKLMQNFRVEYHHQGMAPLGPNPVVKKSYRSHYVSFLGVAFITIFGYE